MTTLSDKYRFVDVDGVTKDANRNPVPAEPRSIAAIAREIRRTWTKPYFGAVPYLDAMLSLNAITDDYGYDSGRSVVLYFLSNASTWRGVDAKRIKAELKKLAGLK